VNHAAARPEGGLERIEETGVGRGEIVGIAPANLQILSAGKIARLWKRCLADVRDTNSERGVPAVVDLEDAPQPHAFGRRLRTEAGDEGQ
jgi:hypothetical protein